MSSGMLLLAGLFATGPVTAPPCETAPMPRAKRGTMQLEFRVDLTPGSLTFGAGVGPAKPDTYRVEAGHGLRIEVPQLGPNTCPNSGPPPEVRMMMLQAIEQMGGPVAVPQPPMCPVQQQCPHPTFVMPVYEEGGNSGSIPFELLRSQHACPAASAQACLPPAPAHVAWSAAPTVGRTMPIGVWSREVGPVRYKIEFKGQSLIATTTLTEEDENGKTFSIDHILTADWYPTRNEHEIVGLVTGFDISTNGKSMKRDDVSGLLGSLADIQKQLSGKPIALTCRHAGDTLMIGNVRLPALKDDFSELSSAFAAMGGNYDAAKVQPPAVLVVPASVGPRQAPRVLREPVRPHPADPTILVPYTFTSPEVPERIGVDFDFNPPRFHGYNHLPPMPPPAPLPKTNPFRNGGLMEEHQSIPASRSNPFRDGRFNW